MRDASSFRVLLTNDDGVDSPGLLLMRASLIEAGFETITVAPDGNRSAMGRSVSVRSRVQLRIQDSGDLNNPVWGTSGTPVDCVRIGLLAEMFPAIDLVLSGINNGVNLGDDVSYSGTVAAAAEAALLGCRAAALSQAGTDLELGFLAVRPERFNHLDWIVRLAELLCSNSSSSGTFLNVNIPHESSARPARQAKLGTRDWASVAVQPFETEDGVEVDTWASDPKGVFADDSDFALLRDGNIVVTPMTASRGVSELSDVDITTELGQLHLAPEVAHDVD